MSDFTTITTNSQIATALVLIVVLLTYIVFRLEDKEPKRTSKSSK